MFCKGYLKILQPIVARHGLCAQHVNRSYKRKPLERVCLFKRFGLAKAGISSSGRRWLRSGVCGSSLQTAARSSPVRWGYSAVGVIRHAHHQVGSQLSCFPSLMETLFQLMLHSRPRSLRRRFHYGIPAGFLERSASRLYGLSGLPEDHKSPPQPLQTGTTQSDRRSRSR